MFCTLRNLTRHIYNFFVLKTIDYLNGPRIGRTLMGTSLNFRIAFFILLGAMLAIRLIFNLRLKRAGERFMPDQKAIQHEGLGLFISRVVLFFVLIAILVLYAINHAWMEALDFYLPPWLSWLGFMIGLLSVALIIWVQLELGRQFSPQLQLRQEHQLVTSGPYSRVRHPLYTAIFGFRLSLALVSANWFFVAFFILSLVGLCLRVPKEEQMMLDQFGDEYQAYMQRTGRFFPKM
jgi:protein-S-isoprenylcysteine O-methyltransferase Ste14